MKKLVKPEDAEDVNLHENLVEALCPEQTCKTLVFCVGNNADEESEDDILF